MKQFVCKPTIHMFPTCKDFLAGFDIGEDVPFSRLYAPIMQVLGAYGNSYVQTLTLNGGTSNVVIAFDALSRWTAANIAIAVV